MKITKEHYSTLRELIAKELERVGEEEVIQARKTVNFINNQFTSFVWFVWRRSTDQSFRSELYQYLNDSHIETALKKILAEFEEI